MKKCADCGWLVIKDSSGRWALFLTVAPTGPLDKVDPHIHKCKATGKEHRVDEVG